MTCLLVLSVSPLAASEVPFAAEELIDQGAGVLRITAAGDIDGDGDVDLAAIGYEWGDDAGLSWLENVDGFGTSWTRHTLGGAAGWVEIADLDQDGDQDLVTAQGQNPGRFYWWQNDGTQSFTQLFIAQVEDAPDQVDGTGMLRDGTEFARSVFVADIDGDGDLDVAGTDQRLSGGGAPDVGRVLWWQNDGTPADGGWTEYIAAADLPSNSLVTADMDLDGHLDLVTCGNDIDSASSKIAWLRSSGSSPPTFTTHLLDSGLPYPKSVDVGDINGDGRLDVVAATDRTGEIRWYDRTGPGFGDWTTHVVSTGVDEVPLSAMLADMDEDGDLDVVGSYLVGPVGSETGAVGWWENADGTGTTWTERLLTVTGPLAHEVEAVDLDLDGDLELVAARYGDDSVVMYRNETNRRGALFAESATLATLAGAAGAGRADIDQDGDLDAIIVTGTGAAWLENALDGFGCATDWCEHTISTTGGDVDTVVVGDLDGDGDADAVGATATSLLWWQNGLGGTAWLETTIDGSVGAADLLVLDLDHDGDLDLVGASPVDDRVTWWQNDGDASFFSFHVVDSVVDGATSVVAGDFDGDGDMDLAATAADAGTVTWWQNDIAGGTTDGWTAATVDGSFAAASGLTAADFDLDGDIDLAGTAGSGGDTVWWENNIGAGVGCGTWCRATAASGFGDGARLEARDLDGDGDADLAAYGASLGLGWLENGLSDLSICGLNWCPETFDGGAAATGAAIDDFDDDGDLDVITAAPGSGQAIFWPNTGGELDLLALGFDVATSDGASDELLFEIVPFHRGRIGDDAVEIASLDLLFSSGAPLAGTELDDLVDNIRLYVDSDDDGVFEPGAADALIFTATAPFTLSSGVLTLTQADGDPNVQIGVLDAVTWWLAADVSATASVSSINSVDVALVDGTSTVEAASTDLPLEVSDDVDAVASISFDGTDISVSKDDGVSTVAAGGSTTYTVVVTNAGPRDDPAVSLTDVLPAALSCTYTSVAAGGATGNTAAGAGDLAETLSMPVGSSVTYTLVCAVNPAAIGSIINTATASASITELNAADDSATDTNTISQEADLSVTKDDGVTAVAAGGSLTYTIVAANAGPSDDPSVTLSDTLPAALSCTYTSVASGGASGNTAAGSGDLAETLSMPAGSSVTYTVGCAVSPSASGSLVNTATVTASVTDGSAANNSATDTNAITQEADVSVTKDDGVTEVVAGGSLTYTIVAANAGPSDDASVSLADTLPAALSCTYTSVASGGAAGNTAAGSGDLAETLSMPAGSSVTYSVSCNVDSAATGSISNTATIAASVTDANASNDTATDTDTVTQEADISVTKDDGVKVVVAGGSLTYTIVAANAGPSDDASVSLTDTLPVELSCVYTSVASGGASGQTAAGSGDLAETLSLPSGSSVTYTVECDLDPAATGSLANTATVTASVTDPTAANDSATDTDAVIQQADLSVTKDDGVTEAVAGGSLTYTIVAANAGPSNDANVGLADTLPAELTCTYTSVASGGASGNTAAGSGDLAETLSMPAGSSVTYTVDCDVDPAASGSIANTATVTASITDPDGLNDQATDTDTVTMGADLSVTKTDHQSYVTPGGQLIYEVVIANAGPSDDPAAQLDDALPGSITCGWTSVASGGATGNTAAGAGDLVETLSLPVGSSVTYTVDCTVDALADEGMLLNTATATASILDAEPANDSATDWTEIVFAANVVFMDGFESGDTSAWSEEVP